MCSPRALQWDRPQPYSRPPDPLLHSRSAHSRASDDSRRPKKLRSSETRRQNTATPKTVTKTGAKYFQISPSEGPFLLSRPGNDLRRTNRAASLNPEAVHVMRAAKLASTHAV